MLQATLKIPADKVATKLLTSRMHGKYCRETGESFSPVRRRLSVSSPAAAPKHGRLTHSAVCLHGYASGRDTRCHPPCTEAPNVTTNAAAVTAVLDQHHQRHQPCLYVEKHSTGKKAPTLGATGGMKVKHGRWQLCSPSASTQTAPTVSYARQSASSSQEALA
jgi:hypothetical protein